jgi:hypothetical protein
MQIYCFYAASSFYAASNGDKPTVKERNWFSYLGYAEDLLQIKTKRPQNQEICKPGLSKATPLGDTTDPLKINEVSSLALSVTNVHPHAPQATEYYYWHSTEAAKLFLPASGESNCLVAVNNQICLLEDALAAYFSYLNIVDIMGEVDRDPSEALSSYQMCAPPKIPNIVVCPKGHKVEDAKTSKLGFFLC